MTERSEIDGGSKQAQRRHRGGRVALWLLSSLVTALALAVWLVPGRPVAAPDWLRDRIEQRIADSLPPGLSLRFGRVSVLIQRSGLPRVILWDVELDNAAGLPIAQLSDIEAAFLPLPLLRGTPVVRELQVSGAVLTLTRDADGRIGLALGDAWGAQAAPGVPQMVAQIDRLLSDPRLQDLALIDADALTIRYEDLRARRGWTVDGGRLRIARTDGVLDLTGDLALLAGGDAAASLELNASSVIGDPSLDFGITLAGLAARDIATQTPALAWLDALDAPISGSLRSRFEEDGRLGPLNAVLNIGAGALAPNPATRPVPFDGARTYFTFDPESGDLRFDEIAVVSPLGQVTAEGLARLQGVETGWPTGLWGQFRLTRIEAREGAVMDRALAFDGAEMAFKLAFKPFRLTLGRLRATDADLPLRLSGELVAAPEGWQLSLDATAERTNPAQVLSFWPTGFRPKARLWVEEHVRQGDVSDVTFALRALPDAPLRTYLDLAFDAGEVLFNKRLPPVQAASGRLVIDGSRLGLRLEAGQLDPGQGGPIDLAGTEVVIADLRDRPATGEISLRARSSGTAALAFVDNEAWQVLRKAGRDVAMATGQVALTGSLRLPLRRGVKLPDVDMDLTAQLDNVASDTLLPGRSLRGDGLTLRIDNEALSIAGPVTVDGVRATGTWRQPLRGGEGGTVTADVAITPQALRAFGIGLPEGMLSGSGSGKLEVALARGAPPRFALSSDLAGLGLSIPQLGWRLAEGAGGQFRIAGRATQPATIESLSLQGGGLDASGDLTLRPGGGLDTLRLERLRLGDWLDVSARLRGRGAGLPPAVEVLGGRADMRSATLGGGGGGPGSASGGGAGAPLSILLDRLQVSQTIVLDRFAGQFDTTGGLRGAFTARVGDTAPIRGEVLPQPGGRSAFRIRGDDAGDILKAAGILKRVQDGSFALDLGPVAGQPGTFDGLLTVRGTRLQGGSAITGLLDAISIVGILDQLNGPGIYFDEVEARFRLDPRRVTVSRSSAVGPSMGISLDGYYDLASGLMDMQGVLSPVYLLNGIGQIFSRRGEGLIGFNFTMTGPAASPRIGVNPLSVFTPGMFRDIFRRPPPKLSQ